MTAVQFTIAVALATARRAGSLPCLKLQGFSTASKVNLGLGAWPDLFHVGSCEAKMLTRQSKEETLKTKVLTALLLSGLGPGFEDKTFWAHELSLLLFAELRRSLSRTATSSRTKKHRPTNAKS